MKLISGYIVALIIAVMMDFIGAPIVSNGEVKLGPLIIGAGLLFIAKEIIDGIPDLLKRKNT